ncbi:ubiquitin-protein ligase E3C-like isoform X2 [Gordionus sp. m RMFG-2023]|uniref:ubiquitin-protein ligase E3C-like isoform X2 n=1 Tax=Gordionus sp. m RMFG-2023 TaxID=3053472 RepID=UPI0031FCC33E
MKMNLFEGEIKKKPVQSLRGASKNLVKENLINKVYAERKQRELLRLKNISAVKIQAIYRGYNSRKNQKLHHRNTYDELFKDLNNTPLNSSELYKRFYNCAIHIIFFFDKSLDIDRLLNLGKSYLNIITAKEFDGSLNFRIIFQGEIHLIGKFYSLFLNAIDIGRYQIPFRIFEVTNSMKKGFEFHDKIILYKYMVTKNYFSILLNFLVNRCPPTIHSPSDAILLPLEIESTLYLMFYPIYLMDDNVQDKIILNSSPPHQKDRNTVWRYFCSQVLSSPLCYVMGKTYHLIFSHLLAPKNVFPIRSFLIHLYSDTTFAMARNAEHDYIIDGGGIYFLNSYCRIAYHCLVGGSDFHRNLVCQRNSTDINGSTTVNHELTCMHFAILSRLLDNSLFSSKQGVFLQDEKSGENVGTNAETKTKYMNNAYIYHNIDIAVDKGLLSPLVEEFDVSDKSDNEDDMEPSTSTETNAENLILLKPNNDLSPNKNDINVIVKPATLLQDLKCLLNSDLNVEMTNTFLSYLCERITTKNSSPHSDKSGIEDTAKSTQISSMENIVTVAYTALMLINYRCQEEDSKSDRKDSTVNIKEGALLLKLAYNYSFLAVLWGFGIKPALETNSFGRSGKSLYELFQTPYLDNHLTSPSSVCSDPKGFLIDFTRNVEVYCHLLSLTLSTIRDGELRNICRLRRSEREDGNSRLPEYYRKQVLLNVLDTIKLFKRFTLYILDYLIPLNVTLLVKKNCATFYTSRYIWVKIFKICTSLLRKLYLRNSRLEFTDPKIWLIENYVISDQINQTNVENFNKLFNVDAKDPLTVYEKGAKMAFKKDDNFWSPTKYQILIQDPRLLKSVTILNYAPFTIPFEQRASFFRNWYSDYEKACIYQRANARRHLFSDFDSAGSWTVDVKIRRTHLYEDSYEKLSPINEPNLKLKMRVKMVNSAGLEEAGIDGGGVFREYLGQLLITAFDANRGLFKHTFVSDNEDSVRSDIENPMDTTEISNIRHEATPKESNNNLVQKANTKYTSDINEGNFGADNLAIYPNPDVYSLVFYDEDMARNRKEILRHYYFLGRMLGKALYENLLVELPLAHFFLSKILDSFKNLRHTSLDKKANYSDSTTCYRNTDLNDLRSIEPVLYKNLMYLARYPKPDEIESVFLLDFSVLEDRFGKIEKIDLIPGGSNVIVNGSNRMQFVYLLGDYKLNKQLDSACNAFANGLSDVIDPAWLGIFTPSELNILIGGRPGPIDVADWKRHTVYSGGYNENDPSIKLFWDIAEFELGHDQLSKLLKFVTSSSRPPLMGFRELNPPFNIQKTSSSNSANITPLNNANQSHPSISQVENIQPSSNTLPTASTCLHLLKLPPSDSKSTMRRKILYAINSMSGFELS